MKELKDLVVGDDVLVIIQLPDKIKNNYLK